MNSLYSNFRSYIKSPRRRWVKLLMNFVLWVTYIVLLSPQTIRFSWSFSLIFKRLSSFLQVLSIQQLYRISTMYWDDKYGTHSVSSDVSCSLTWVCLAHVKSISSVLCTDLLSFSIYLWLPCLLMVFPFSDCIGHFEYESYDDRGIKQFPEQFFSVRRWLKVISFC